MGGAEVETGIETVRRHAPDRARRVLSYVFLCAIVIAPLVAGTAIVFSRDPLRSCQHNAPGDLTGDHFALSSSSDHWRGTLTCSWSGRPGTPTRETTLPIYRWPINADD